jgi:hypothetical protein
MLKKFALTVLGAVAMLGAIQTAFAQEAITDGVPKAILETRDSYMVVTRQDTRKCMYPICGGYFVKNVNKSTTRCADGTLQRECHAVQLNTLALGWTPEQQSAFEEQLALGKAMVKGYLEPAPAGLYTAEQLKVTEAWQGQGKRKAAGTWYSAYNTGIVCIKAPCPSFAASKLNAGGKLPAPTINPDLDLSSLTGATEAQVQAAFEVMNGGNILIAGSLVPVRYTIYNGSTTRGTKLLATQFYLPAKP